MDNGKSARHRCWTIMVTDFNDYLHQELAAIDDAGLRRELRRIDSGQGARVELVGRELLNFSSNDYLGLATHPALKTAAAKAVEEFGAGDTIIQQGDVKADKFYVIKSGRSVA